LLEEDYRREVPNAGEPIRDVLTVMPAR